MNLLDRVCTVAWAIRPEALEVIVGIADRQDLSEETVRSAMHHQVTAPQAVAASRGTPIDGASLAYRRGTVGVVPVIGPIVRYGSMFSSVSGGATSVSSIGLDFNLALADPLVESIVLHVDSPGGESNGIGELSDMIAQARGQKPITAYVSDLGASAGYWIASAADEIVVAETAALGSIGVVAAVRDPDKAESDEIEFVSSVSPNKRLDVRTKHGKAQIQALVDTLGEIFVAGVARNRGVDAQTVVNDFGRGGLLVGQDAVTAGLADRLGSFEGVLRQQGAHADADTAPSATRPAAASLPAAPAAIHPRRPRVANMRERFMAWLDGLDAPNASADQEAQIVSEHLTDEKRVVNTLPVASPQPPPPAAQPLRAADDDALRVRLAAVEAENQRLRLTGITETATRYAQDLFRDGRAMPSEQTAITAAYIRAALDDMYTPVSDGPTRVALIQASYAARESRRQILGELVGDDVLTLLHDKARGPKRSAEGDVPTAERTDELLGMTSLGRRTIEARNGNGTGAH